MINKYLKLYLIILGLILFALNASAESGSGNINFQLGQKRLSKADWEPVENQEEIAVRFDYREKNWPISIAIDYLISDTKDTAYLSDDFGNSIKIDLTGSTTELAVGIRKIWEIKDSSIRPFFGGGIVLINAEIKIKPHGYSNFSDDDDNIGTWLNGGVYWIIGKHLNLGLELRWSHAEVTLHNYKGDVGGFHNGFFVGWHW